MIRVEYDEKSNKCQAVKSFLGGTTSYIGVIKICPICGDYIQGYPAISRKDNRTEICSRCGTLEAIEEFKKYHK